jgi:AcrR family transcriptional regulator
MTEDTGRRPDKPTGRKRDADLTAAILKAAGVLLLDVGFDRLRIQDVADQVGAGRGTIYRRWSTKEALLAEAIRALPDYQPDITDDPVADLRAIVDRRCFSAYKNPDLVPGLISAMRADSDIEQAVKDGYTVEYLRDAIARIIGRDNPHIAVLTELTPAIVLHRSTYASESFDPVATAEEIMALIQSFAESTGS